MLVSLLVANAMAADCAQDPIHVDGAGYSDLATALAAATDGDEVEVCPGTYVGTFVATVPVALIALGSAADTTLDGNDAGTVLTVAPGSIIDGFTITGGASDDAGGGILLSNAGELTVIDSTVDDNDAATRGGGIAVPGGSIVELRGSRITNNTARNGGGISAEDGFTTLHLGDSIIEGNEAQGEQLSEFSVRAGLGGGIELWDGEITDGLVMGNQAYRPFRFSSAGSGGGISARRQVRIEGTHIVDNFASSGGGLDLGRSSTLVDVLVEFNRADRNGGGADVSTFDDVVEITLVDSMFRNNEARFNGGGVIANASGDTLIWRGGVFEGNLAGSDDATSGSGGGLLAIAGTLEFHGVVFRNNVADGGYAGGLGTNFGNPFRTHDILIDGCHFLHNVAGGRDGGGADIGFGGTIRNSTFEGNTAAGNGGGMTMYGYGSLERFADGPLEYTLENNSYRGNRAGDIGGGLLVETNAVVTASEIEVADNRATQGGGIGIVDGTIELASSDLGACPDNLPDDVFAQPSGMRERGYDAVGMLFCDETTCTPSAPALGCANPADPVCADPTARVSRWATVGDGTRVGARATVRDRAQYGTDGLIGPRATVGHDSTSGDLVQVCDGANVRDRALLSSDVTVDVDATIGSDADLGTGVVVGPQARVRDRVTVGEGARIGAGATIGFDAEIGADTHIGANVLMRDRSSVGAGAVIGDGAQIGFDVHVPDGARVPAGAVLR